MTYGSPTSRIRVVGVVGSSDVLLRHPVSTLPGIVNMEYLTIRLDQHHLGSMIQTDGQTNGLGPRPGSSGYGRHRAV